MHLSIYIYIYTHTCTLGQNVSLPALPREAADVDEIGPSIYLYIYLCVYIYIYRERER